MDSLAESLLSAGWAVANVEYRRGTDTQWPAPLDDVRAAIAAVRAHAASPSLALIGIGHSVGGQLALLTAPLLDAVVALAPVTDLARTYREGLGEDAVREFFGISPEEDPALYRAASPLAQAPGDTPTLVVHGDSDVRVPVEHSRRYLAAVVAAGGTVSRQEHPGLGHIELIDPEAVHWPGVLDWMAEHSRG